MRKIELKILEFLDKSVLEEELFSGSGHSLFGRLFREYIYLTIKDDRNLNLKLCEAIESHLKLMEDSISYIELSMNKGYLQLLCFYLSYRNYFSNFTWSSNVTKLITKIPIESYLSSIGAHLGVPGSGNFSMFIAILIYDETRDRNDYRIKEWFDFMDSNINKDGLWGINHFIYQMQNGYHQYEIYKFFEREQPVRFNVDKLISYQDSLGHFGPFMGGGACYDFDAVDLLVQHGNRSQITSSLVKLALNLELEQNIDGGFCESVYIGKSITSLPRLFLYSMDNLNMPRLKSFIKLTLNYRYYSRIKTHWSPNHRRYSDSDLWGTWFRLLTLLKINSFIERNTDRSKIFNFPGIGF